MSRNLREEIEKADRERQQAQYLEEQRIRKIDEQRQQSDWLKSQNERQILNEANANFDRYLLPIFQQVAEAKNIPMRDPYKVDFVTDYFRSRSIPNTGSNGPKRSGFVKQEDKLKVRGEMYWDITMGEYDWFWSSLFLTMDHTGLVDEGYNVLTSKGLSLLEKDVVKHVTSGACVDNHYNRPPQDLSM